MINVEQQKGKKGKKESKTKNDREKKSFQDR